MQNRYLFFILTTLFLSACTSNTYAPVSDIATIQPIPTSGRQLAKPGESLYEIAWRYGLDYHDLARRNRIPAPYKIKKAEHIYLKGPTRQSRDPSLSLGKTTHTLGKTTHWHWPATGKIIKPYEGLNKGINIAAAFASPIYAANAGNVVYSGNGLRGYGNLIIIKHNSDYMSAYAHNYTMFVKEGDSVRKGQKIAQMGSSGTDKVMLHFEIRKRGKPVNPMDLLR